MHETVIARRLIEEAEKQGNVQAITVEIGEVANITKDDLMPTLTSLVDWEVTIGETKAEASCACGYIGSPKILGRGHGFCLYECPTCGHVPEVIRGKDIVLKRVELR